MVPLQCRTRHKKSPHSAIFGFLEGKAPGAGMEGAAEHALTVTVAGIDHTARSRDKGASWFRRPRRRPAAAFGRKGAREENMPPSLPSSSRPLGSEILIVQPSTWRACPSSSLSAAFRCSLHPRDAPTMPDLSLGQNRHRQEEREGNDRPRRLPARSKASRARRTSVAMPPRTCGAAGCFRKDLRMAANSGRMNDRIISVSDSHRRKPAPKSVRPKRCPVACLSDWTGLCRHHTPP